MSLIIRRDCIACYDNSHLATLDGAFPRDNFFMYILFFFFIRRNRETTCIHITFDRHRVPPPMQRCGDRVRDEMKNRKAGGPGQPLYGMTLLSLQVTE